MFRIQKQSENNDKIENPRSWLSRLLRPNSKPVPNKLGIGVVITILVILIIETRLIERLI